MASNTKFQINGIIDTSENVLSNIDQLATSSGCFISWDPSLGQWSVILNTTSVSVKSFDDDNIIGEINVSGSGINEQFNSVSVQFPNRDTRDTVDVIELEIASADRYPQELDNRLEMSLPTVNDPVQAQYIATRELKQNRLDKIIEFRANFEANNIRAGDLVDITNTTLDFTNKLFRVIQVDEQDTDEGNLVFSVIAQEYDADVYSDAGLKREFRSNFTGIKSKIFNTDIDAKEDFAFGNTMGRLLAANLGLGLLRSFLTSDEGSETNQQELKFDNQATQEMLEAGAKKPSLTHAELTPGIGTTKICSGSPITINASHDCEVCFIETPNYTYDYTITGCTANEVNVPLTGTITTTAQNATFSFTPTVEEEKTIQVEFGDNTTSYEVSPAPTKYASNVVASQTSITEGDTITSITVTTVGIADGQTINYAITGSASSKVSGTPLTGTVTINSNTGSLTSIATTDDATYNDSEDLIFTFTATGEPNDYCSISTPSVTIQVLNDDATGPITPDVPKPGDYQCSYASVPIAWCATFDPDTNRIKAIEVKKTAQLPTVTTGGQPFPLTCSVTNPGEASAAISIDTTVRVDTTAGIGGARFDVIYAFDNNVGGGASGTRAVTGSTIAVYGFFE